MSWQTTVCIPIERNDEEIEVFVEMDCSPEEKPVYWDKNGEGHPGSPEAFDVISVMDRDGIEYYLTERETERAIDEVRDKYSE